MKFGNLVSYLLLISFFYLVIGQTTNEEKSDCTKILNFINGDSKDYANSCCSDNTEIKCFDDGYIRYIKL